MPLEVLVERQRVRAPRSATTPDADARRRGRTALPAHARAAAAVEGAIARPSSPASRFSRCAAQLAAADEDTARFVQTMVGRAPDGAPARGRLRATGRPSSSLDAALKIAAADRAEVAADGRALARLVRQRCSASRRRRATMRGCRRRAWNTPCRWRHGCRRDAGDERRSTASEFYDGHLDWSSFDVNAEVNIGRRRRSQSFSAIVETTIPAPVTLPRRARARASGRWRTRASTTACCRWARPTSRSC